MIIVGQTVPPIDFAGLRIFDYTAGRAGQASLAIVELPPGASHRLAWSRRSEKYYLVLEGGVQFTVDGATHDLTAGDLCLIRQGQHFLYHNPHPIPARLVLVHTPPFAIEDEVFVDHSAPS